jgi:phosphatidylglycerophosphatase A
LSRTPDGLRTACITGLGSGFAPFAPGTWGSLVALLLFTIGWWAAAGATWRLAPLTAGPRVAVEAITVAGILIACTLSVRWGAWAVARFASPDPKPFTLDEVAGQWVALLLLPPAAATGGLWSFACVAGGQFCLFRLFDVLKPPPARQAESLPAGWGILTDDLFAGLYANIVGQLIWRLTPLPQWLGV